MRKISLATAIIIGMNAMIGSGIFSAPAIMASNVGPAGILAYIFVVLSVWFIAQSMARLAELFPEAGSFYIYTKAWAGHAIGLFAISSYLIGLIVAMGLLAQLAGFYLYPFYPLYTPQTLGLFVLAALVFLNMCGVIFSELGQQILIICTVFPLVVTTIICFTQAKLSFLTPFAPYGFTNVLKATRIVIFGFFGFECAISLFTLVENPRKNVPKALTYSILLVGALYILFITSIIMSTPIHYFSNPMITIPDILHHIFPRFPWLSSIIHISILSAILGTIHSMIWSSGALLQNILHKTLYVRKISLPFSIALIGLCIFISFVTFKNLNLFFNFTAFFIILAFILSIIALLTIKQEQTPLRYTRTFLSLATALLIFFFALEGIVQELF